MSLVSSPFFLAQGVIGDVTGQSIRFEDDDSPYFSFEFGTPTNQIKWTMSFWCKRGEIGREHAIYGAANGGGETFFVAFYPDDIEAYISSGRNHVTNAVFRDPSAWYHIVQVFDSANATADDRFITYVNGVRQTTSTNAVTLNDTIAWNTSGVTGYFGKNYGAWFGDSRDYFDGYFANVTFIDGQALDPTSFGEYSDTLWKPKADTVIQSLTFGTNGFYLPFKQTTEAEGFSAVTYTGNGAIQAIDGVGFEPDFVWLKGRNEADSHVLTDSVRGTGKTLKSDSTDAETNSADDLVSFNSSGFTKGTNDRVGGNNDTMVGWCWDAGDNLASTGFAAVNYLGNGATQSINGLGFEPDFVWIKERDATSNHGLFDSVRGAGKSLKSDDSAVEQTQTDSLTSFDSNGFTLGDNTEAGPDVNFTNGNDYVAWCWDAGSSSAASNTNGSITSSVKANTTQGFSIATYTGNATDGATIGHGLSQSPDMVIVKDRTNSASWRVMHKDISYASNTLYLDANFAETADDRVKAVSSTTFTVTGGGGVNGSARDHVAYSFHSVSGYSSFGSYTGNGSTTGPVVSTGFRPAFVMIKRTDTADNWIIYDTTRSPFNPADKGLFPNDSGQELTGNDIDFNASDFQLKTSDNGFNASGGTYIYMAFAGGQDLISPVNTDGTITSRVKANTAKGFSITSFVGNATAGATVGHGLTSTPEMIISKNRDDANNWLVYHKDLDASNPEQKRIFLNLTSAVSDSNTPWNDTAPTSSLLTLGTSGYTNGSNDDMIMYCFHSVSGYSSFGTYSGTGSAGNAVTTGFEPAFVMVKRIDDTSDWAILDNTRDVDTAKDSRLRPNSSAVESTVDGLRFSSTGFSFADGSYNNSGSTWIYMAFAETRNATFFGDTSGNNNDWTPYALTNTDVVLDAPVSGGNFATYNSVLNTALVLSEGNLKAVYSSAAWRTTSATFYVSSGKWYWETRNTDNDYHMVGIVADSFGTYTNFVGSTADSYSYYNWASSGSAGFKYNNNVATSYGDQWAAGDIIGVALDLDAGTIEFYKNNVSQGVAFTGISGTYAPAESLWTSGSIANFGQDSSFAGNEAPQGNTDDNGVGDFYYAPPSGFLALSTSNLPAATITLPDEYFNTVLYAGNNTTGHAITGVNFQSDWTWIKLRNGASGHRLVDSVRGVTKYLDSTGTSAETTNTDRVTSFDSDGFTLGNSATVNGGFNYVAWNWLAGGTAVSNTDGDINSQVSAKQDAGFSVVTYTGNGTTDQTIGHGLGAAPDMIIVKKRSTTGNWLVWHRSVTSGNGKYMFLDLTNALSGPSVVPAWDSTNTTTQSSTTTFDVGANSTVNGSGSDYVAYLFSEVEGYSKVGSYTGNGSSDGTFVHCGFRPAWVMLKAATGAVQHWWMFDNKREGYNVDNDQLYANLSSAEGTSNILDFTSNGFKLRTSSAVANGSGQTFIFLAFAESPFKSANAR